jgi:hypothetical protein
MRFDVTEVEQRLGITLDPSLFDGWAGQPVMVATAIMPATTP